MKKHLSPCLTCTRVADPEDCTDKSCRVWQNWFLEQWERVRVMARQSKDVLDPVGVPLGGNHYAAPHQVQAYLEIDPCVVCLCPRELCTASCGKRRNWEQAKKEVSG